jgi:hypothetical protein
MNTQTLRHDDQSTDDSDQFVRIPGLFRRWELEAVLAPGVEYRIEEQGSDSAGTRLFAVYRRDPITITEEVS